MSELKKLINKYLSKDTTAQVYYELSQDKFNKVVKGLGIYERPDILSVYDNIILGIEHFEFDSYNRSNKKGSDYKVKDYRVEKRLNEEIKDKLQNNDSIIVHDEIDSTATLNNYCRNFEDILKIIIKRYNHILIVLNRILIVKIKKFTFAFLQRI